MTKLNNFDLANQRFFNNFNLRIWKFKKILKKSRYLSAALNWEAESYRKVDKRQLLGRCRWGAMRRVPEFGWWVWRCANCSSRCRPVRCRWSRWCTGGTWVPTARQRRSTWFTVDTQTAAKEAINRGRIGAAFFPFASHYPLSFRFSPTAHLHTSSFSVWLLSRVFQQLASFLSVWMWINVSLNVSSHFVVLLFSESWVWRTFTVCLPARWRLLLRSKTRSPWISPLCYVNHGKDSPVTSWT